MIAFESLSDFFAMGGHGPYVWSTYGLCIAIMTWTAVQPMLARRRYINDLARRLDTKALS